MTTLHEIKITEGKFTATLEIWHDLDCEDPNDFGGGVQVFTAQNGGELGKKIVETFEDEGAAVAALGSGEVYKEGGVWYYGLEEYRHGQSAFALTSNRGNFPDRRWDVIPFVGWVSIDENEISDPEQARDLAKGSMQIWQAYVNGECYGFSVEMEQDGNDGWYRPVEAEMDSCGGFLGDLEDCQQQAIESAEISLRKLTGNDDLKLKSWGDYE